ncbi:MAG: Fe-S-binding domain-containing protein, partial [Actinobacteria bacterium]|nr:Fe-S-binding domain-containing protein [Actinomycetota bacterium]MSY13843.1 Fe-S-binding domain-containing protein [Actinomycetota bacterium]
MSESTSFPILTALVLTPAIGAVVVSAVSKRRPDLVKLLALSFSGISAAMSIWLLCTFRSGEAGMQFVSKHAWIKPWGISWNLGVDGISIFLVVLTGLLWPIALLGADAHHDEKPYAA